MDLSTTYLGLKLPHPFMPGASPFTEDLDAVRRLEDAGASAIVMHSLFEEQLVGEQAAVHAATAGHENAHAEARSYFPDFGDYRLGPEEYLEQIAKIKKAVKVPVIGSLNGTSVGGWIDYARRIEKAGADALELNIYQVNTDPNRQARLVESDTLGVLRGLKRSIDIPIAVKLSPFYTSLPHFAANLVKEGASGLVLFNRFYQPDIDGENLEVNHRLPLSDSAELPLRLRWLAILSGQIDTSYAVTGGVHTGLDAVKAVMSGAHAVQMVSALLKTGPGQLREAREEAARWLEEHEYESLEQARGSMNLAHTPDPYAYERGNYVKVLGTMKRSSGGKE